jgi:PhnB protein
LPVPEVSTIKQHRQECLCHFVSRSGTGPHFVQPRLERENLTMKLTTYLNYGGNCGQAIRFYEKHLGAKITEISTYDQMPAASNVPPEMKDAIMHVRMTIAGTEIMASDVPSGRFQPMRSVYLALSVGSTEEAERIYALLSEGAEIFTPMQENFFAFRFAMLRDKFGTSWMIIHERPMPSGA